MSNKAYFVELNGRSYQIIEIDGLVIGFPQDMTYEVATSSVLKYPAKTLQTAAKRLFKKRTEKLS